ncbi:MAG: sigma factor, partial [Pseudomonadota bacterium]
MYSRHKSYVAKVAARFGADRDQIFDIIQDTFSYLLRKFPPPGEGLILTAKFTTFLYPVIKHTTLEAKR